MDFHKIIKQKEPEVVAKQVVIIQQQDTKSEVVIQ